MTPTSKAVPAGTQVVSLLAVHGSHETVVHPRGAVGVITRTPVGTEVNYTVRFPDGFEAALTIDQFEILKHFKDRLDDPSGTADLDLKSLLIFSCITGSRAYGLDTVESDVDRRGVYLAPAKLQWSLYGAPEQFEDNTAQPCYWELQKFLVLALKANPNVLECLYSPLVELATALGQELLALRERFSTSSPPAIWCGWPNCSSPAHRNRRGRDARRARGVPGHRETARKRCGPRRRRRENRRAQRVFSLKITAISPRSL